MNWRILTWTFFCLLLSYSATGQTYADYIAEGNRFYDEKDYVAALTSYQRAFEIETAQPNYGEWYNAACAAAKSGENDMALAYLNQSIDIGWTSLEWMLNDIDLATLHNEPDWQKLVDKLTAIRATIEKDWNIDLIEELKVIKEKDQRFRKEMAETEATYGWNSPEMNALWDQQTVLDQENIKAIESIVAEHGYPSRNVVGDQSNTVFLVIQHSDPDTQEKYLPLLEKAAETSNLRFSSLVMLTDRLCMNKNEPQVYGTQLLKDSETGRFVFYPIKDEKNVNKRRAKVGLGPIEEYARRFNLEYKVPE